jgi:hypothetical protein
MREEMAGGFRRLHNEELHDLCASPIIIRVTISRRIRWEVHVARMIYMRNAYKILVGYYEVKGQFGRPRKY